MSAPPTSVPPERPPGTEPGISRRRFVTGAAAAGVVGAVAGAGIAVAATPAAATPAAAAAPTGAPVADRFAVVLDTAGLTAPATVPSGVVGFQVSTPQDGGRALLLLRLRDGAVIEDFLANLAITSSPDPTVRAAAARELEAAAEYLGGGVVSGGVEAGFTRVLAPGTYHLVNFNYASATETPPYATLTATAPAAGGWPATDDLVVHTQQGDDWGFHVPSDTLRASGSHLVVNSTSSPHELMLAPVRPGTTIDEVRAYYASMSTGTVPPQDQVPITGWPNGLGSIGPGGAAVLHTDFPPGEYLMFSYITNSETGFPRAYEGMFRLTTLV